MWPLHSNNLTFLFLASMATTAPPTGPTTVPATSQVQVTVAGTANQTSSFPATVPNTSLDSAAVNTVTSGMAGTTAKSVDSVASIGSLSLSQLRSVLSSLLQEFIGSSVNNKGNVFNTIPLHVRSTTRCVKTALTMDIYLLVESLNIPQSQHIPCFNVGIAF